MRNLAVNPDQIFIFFTIQKRFPSLITRQIHLGLENLNSLTFLNSFLMKFIYIGRSVHLLSSLKIQNRDLHTPTSK